MNKVECQNIEELGKLPLSFDKTKSQETNVLPQATVSSDKKPSRILLFGAFAAIYLIWGSTYLGIKYAIETLPPFLMASTRFLVAGAILYVWARAVQKEEKPKPIYWRTSSIVGILLLLGGNGGVVVAQHYIPSGLAALLVAVEPLWIVLLSWFFMGGGRPNLKTIAGLTLGFVGVWLLVGQTSSVGEAASNPMQLFGAGLVLAAAFSWACGSLYGLRAASPASPLLASGMQMLAGGASLLLVGLIAGEWSKINFNNFSAVSIGALLYLIVFGSIVAFTAYSWLLRNANPAHVATYAYVNPVVAIILGWAFAGETLGWQALFGAAVVVASVALVASYGKDDKSQRAEN